VVGKASCLLHWNWIGEEERFVALFFSEALAYARENESEGDLESGEKGTDDPGSVR